MNGSQERNLTKGEIEKKREGAKRYMEKKR